MKFTSPGAHTNQSRGITNPVRAVARCVAGIYYVPLPDPQAPVQAIHNAGGMMSAGDIVNAVPREVTFTVDLRTVGKQMLGALDEAIVSKCDQSARAHKVTFTRAWIQKSAAGGHPKFLPDRPNHPIVQTAVDVLKCLGFKVENDIETSASGFTDANVGVVSGIPSVAVGAPAVTGLICWAQIDSARIGRKQIVLLAASLTESS